MDEQEPHRAEQDLTPATRRALSEIADMATDERTARIILALGCEPGDELAPQLAAAHGAVHLVRQITDGALQEETPRLARWRQDVTARLDLTEVSRVLMQTQERGLGTLIPGEPGWPALAGSPATHPLVLWTRGDASHLTSSAPRVAVLGARFPTDYGRDVTRTLAIDLADRGVTILGSSWPGVDATALLGAAVAGGPAITVLPAGLDRRPYPATMPPCSGQPCPTVVFWSALAHPVGPRAGPTPRPATGSWRPWPTPSWSPRAPTAAPRSGSPSTPCAWACPSGRSPDRSPAARAPAPTTCCNAA